MGILGLFIVRSNSLSDYALGLVVGVTIGSYALSIYYFAALRHSKRLHQMYITTYDERNKKILQVAQLQHWFWSFRLSLLWLPYMPLLIFSSPMLQSYLSCSMAWFWDLLLFV
ncbi:protein of unknown function [Streptococcus thermophilus]|uniref:Uncharacterized protein n=1 Tax=Streptococcus thermophilus TaxID=1308 RepID=A0A7U7CBH3_STRTR|nr:protein of unknown function [Streptococcus thermophilus]CAD0146302.1 protein of unknown function [Streptococcus thermophilus]CAD0148729.1 protein of unknown function [Streptococcus thermophilus]CAD0151723.1 protein of unknown function [Streptococcus thermophilus]CAD0153319.1 protein of unknown function [Streptococcus thermophilus]